MCARRWLRDQQSVVFLGIVELVDKPSIALILLEPIVMSDSNFR